jgi:uncharacterized protein YecE (DUF72 family)
MIRVGLAGWGDHDKLYPPGTKPHEKLREYGKRLSVVEVDSTFYAVQTPERFEAWTRETPEDFHFVVKAYQGMTGHQRGKPLSSEELEAAYTAFRESLEPARGAGKLKAVLFQYPPWFDCTRDSVRILRETKARMEGLPCALEFRHQSWFASGFREKTLDFMATEGWIHSICDEPQAGAGSVPTVLHATHPEVTIVRMHGRNRDGWNAGGSANWREVRYLYRYSAEELAEWSERLHELEEQTKEICVIFNNNSGGDAADNAADLMRLLGQAAPELPGQATPELPEQLDLFDSP